MSSITPNYGLIKPGVNDPTDQDLWGGMLNENMDTIDTTMKSISNVADAAGRLPIGSLYFNADVGTNPSTLLGYGTWVAFGEGRVIIGAGTGTDANGEVKSFAAGDTGGEYEHTLTEPELPIVIPQTRGILGSPGGSVNPVPVSYPAGSLTFNGVPFGNDDAHNNIQPYITVYAWRRTA